MAVARFCRILVIIAGRILKRLVGQLRGDQFFLRESGKALTEGRKSGALRPETGHLKAKTARSRLKPGSARRANPTNFYSRGFA